jgi:2-polyprenyl-6-methoxyphenol hydroxylase-like FAD-dependent oxidoreductase
MPRNAVVIGASVSGLVTARVLADHFDRVTLIERDRLPAGADLRAGVPQAQHVHLLLGKGKQIVEQLLPGFGADMAAAGAILVDEGADVAWLTPAGWSVRYRSGLGMHASSRSMLEWQLRRRVAEHPRIEIVDGIDVLGLAADGDGARVVGVRTRPRGGAAAAEQTLAAHFVVDASGRGSRAPAWLSELGYPEPDEEIVDAHIGYASRVYRPSVDPNRDWLSAYVQLAPPRHTRAGLIAPLEGNRWLITLVGAAGDYPPTDDAGFLEFARSMRSPILYEAIKDAEPLSGIQATRSTNNRRRRYDRLARWPERFVVTGDAVAAFNPVYGQGMSVASIEALELGQQLARAGGGLDGVAARFQRRLGKVTAEPWMVSTSEDFRVAGVVGGPPPLIARFMHRYLDRLTLRSTQDPEVRQALLLALNLLTSAPALFHPRLIARLIRHPAGPAAVRPGLAIGAPPLAPG